MVNYLCNIWRQYHIYDFGTNLIIILFLKYVKLNILKIEYYINLRCFVMDFYDRLRKLCKDKNTSITAFLGKYDLSSSKGTMWKNGAMPKIDVALLISEEFNVSLDYLFTGKESSPSELSEDEQELLTYFKDLPHDQQQQLIGMAILLQEQVKEQEDEETNGYQPLTHNIQIVQIKRYKYPSGAGKNIPLDEKDVYDLINLPYDKVPLHADSLIRINGDSMEPDYPANCWVWVNTNLYGNLKDYIGKTVIANNNGEMLLKIIESDGLHSINHKYKTIKVDESCFVFGVVINVVEDELVDFIEKAKAWKF